jgi:hypothetical protein
MIDQNLKVIDPATLAIKLETIRFTSQYCGNHAVDSAEKWVDAQITALHRSIKELEGYKASMKREYSLEGKSQWINATITWVQQQNKSLDEGARIQGALLSAHNTRNFLKLLESEEV